MTNLITQKNLAFFYLHFTLFDTVRIILTKHIINNSNIVDCGPEKMLYESRNIQNNRKSYTEKYV